VICEVSAKAAALFKAAPSDLIGLDLFAIIPIIDMRELARLRIFHIVNRGELHDQELPLSARDGSIFWVRVQTHRIDDNTFISYLDYIGTHNPHYNGT
jgi:PAS domain-containing protein